MLTNDLKVTTNPLANAELKTPTSTVKLLKNERFLPVGCKLMEIPQELLIYMSNYFTTQPYERLRLTRKYFQQILAPTVDIPNYPEPDFTALIDQYQQNPRGLGLLHIHQERHFKIFTRNLSGKTLNKVQELRLGELRIFNQSSIEEKTSQLIPKIRQVDHLNLNGNVTSPKIINDLLSAYQNLNKLTLSNSMLPTYGLNQNIFLQEISPAARACLATLKELHLIFLPFASTGERDNYFRYLLRECRSLIALHLDGTPGEHQNYYFLRNHTELLNKLEELTITIENSGALDVYQLLGPYLTSLKRLKIKHLVFNNQGELQQFLRNLPAHVNLEVEHLDLTKLRVDLDNLLPGLLKLTVLSKHLVNLDLRYNRLKLRTLYQILSYHPNLKILGFSLESITDLEHIPEDLQTAMQNPPASFLATLKEVTLDFQKINKQSYKAYDILTYMLANRPNLKNLRVCIRDLSYQDNTYLKSLNQFLPHIEHLKITDAQQAFQSNMKLWIYAHQLLWSNLTNLKKITIEKFSLNLLLDIFKLPHLQETQIIIEEFENKSAILGVKLFHNACIIEHAEEDPAISDPCESPPPCQTITKKLPEPKTFKLLLQYFNNITRFNRLKTVDLLLDQDYELLTIILDDAKKDLRATVEHLRLRHNHLDTSFLNKVLGHFKNLRYLSLSADKWDFTHEHFNEDTLRVLNQIKILQITSTDHPLTTLNQEKTLIYPEEMPVDTVVQEELNNLKIHMPALQLYKANKARNNLLFLEDAISPDSRY